jgi:hypothetical protein
MRTTLTAVTIAVLAALAAGVYAQRTSDYRDPDLAYEEGWTSLFNGKDLAGWVPVLQTGENTHRRYREHEVGEQSTFFVKDGMLMTTGKPNGYVRTADVYDNFVFHVEIRYTQQGNTGVLIHVQQDAVWPKGIECQGYQSHMGRIFPIVGATMEGGEMIHAAAKPTGEWNTYDVYSEEGRVATVLNGAIVGLGSNANPRVGHIALQSEGVPVEFRNIRVKRYTPAWPLRPK